MHELSISISLVEQALAIMQKEGDKRARRMTLEVGAFSGISIEALHFCFPEATKGTALENCHLIIKQIPLCIYCPTCKKEVILKDPFIMCSHCHEVQVEVIRGKEFNLLSMEVE